MSARLKVEKHFTRGRVKSSSCSRRLDLLIHERRWHWHVWHTIFTQVIVFENTFFHWCLSVYVSILCVFCISLYLFLGFYVFNIFFFLCLYLWLYSHLYLYLYSYFWHVWHPALAQDLTQVFFSMCRGSRHIWHCQGMMMIGHYYMSHMSKHLSHDHW